MLRKMTLGARDYNALARSDVVTLRSASAMGLFNGDRLQVFKDTCDYEPVTARVVLVAYESGRHGVTCCYTLEMDE